MTKETISMLGGGSNWSGKLEFEGMARIDSDFSGEIVTTGTLVVGKTAYIKAQIQVGKLVLNGALEGQVHATQMVVLDSTAVLTGDVHTPSIVTMAGAVLNGTLKMNSLLD